MKCGSELVEAIVETQGNTARIRSSGLFFRYCATLAAPAVRLRWERTTPFGFPVLPGSIKNGGHIAVDTTMGCDTLSLREGILPAI